MLCNFVGSVNVSFIDYFSLFYVWMYFVYDFRTSEEFMTDPSQDKWKRHTVLSNDSGYSTTDSLEKIGWSPNVSEVGPHSLLVLCFCVIRVCADLWKSFFVWFLILFFNFILKKVTLLERLISLHVPLNRKLMLLCYMYYFS